MYYLKKICKFFGSRPKTTLFVLYLAAIVTASFRLVLIERIAFIIFSIVLGLAYFILIGKRKEVQIKKAWVFLPIIIILLVRIIPYIYNSVPLGYDPGIYKYAFETYWGTLPHINLKQADWFQGMYPPGLFIFGDLLYLVGYPIQFILTHFLIIIELFLGLAVYLFVKKIESRNTAIIAVILFAISIVQFQTFWWGYYKNILGLFLILVTFYLLEKKSYLAILTGTFLAATHRPTFLLFGLSLIAYFIFQCIRQRKFLKQEFITGLSILFLSFPFYFETFRESILSLVEPVLGAVVKGGGPGTFMDFDKYIYYTLIYIPFALLGATSLIRKRKFSYLFFCFLFSFVIVFFKMFFYNRFIIHLDLMVVILASITFYEILQAVYKNIYGKLAVWLLVGVGVAIIFLTSARSHPLISEQELERIKGFCNLPEKEAYVMATDKHYSPWLLGYSCHRTIAPGLFEWNKWDKTKWMGFWFGSPERRAELMHEYDEYEEPIYIYVGERQPQMGFEGAEGLEKIEDYLWRYRKQ